MIPGGTNPLEVLTCGQPVVTQGSSGYGLAKNMKTGFDYVGIHAGQIESGVFHGVYFHCSIEENLGHLYKLKPGKVLFTWDQLHKTGWWTSTLLRHWSGCSVRPSLRCSIGDPIMKSSEKQLQLED